ncbi:MAG: hypothetical protein VYA34_02485 [Myxococcota bacterium]|nr:hypothetical protein [Myxococcota bacterium]
MTTVAFSNKTNHRFQKNAQKKDDDGHVVAGETVFGMDSIRYGFDSAWVHFAT